MELSTNLENELRHLLLNCGPFSSNAELRALFVDNRLKPWRQALPDARSPLLRVEATVDFLSDKFHQAYQANALLLFLQVLAERLDAQDECRHRLQDFALDLKVALFRQERNTADQRRRELHTNQRVVNLRPLDTVHSFKDRLRETKTLCQHLANSQVRFIAVVGRGGMGKTALASRVLAQLEEGVLPIPGGEREHTVDGILYLSARSTGLTLERIFTDVGRLLGEPAATKLGACWTDQKLTLSAKVQCLLELLRDGIYLILLDNFEDFLTVEGSITDAGLETFIEACTTQPSGAQLVVTSRRQIQIPSSSLTAARTVPLRQGIPEREAIELLRELDPQDELGLRGAPVEQLSRISELTQGIPRALEIVAGILRQDPTVNLSDILAGDLFDEYVLDRLVSEGYQSLSTEHKRVMEALAVYDRPVPEAAVAYLLHPWFPDVDVLEKLRQLTNSYFVSVNRISKEYSLHPLDQEYAYKQIPSSQQEGEYNQVNLELRAADFFKTIRKPEEEWHALMDLVPRLAEFEHRIRAADYDTAYKLTEPISFSTLVKWGHYPTLVNLWERLLGRVRDPELQSAHLGHLAILYRAMGRVDEALRMNGRALEIAREIDSPRWKSAWLGNAGICYRILGQLEKAIHYLEEGLAVAEEAENRIGIMSARNNLGTLFISSGQPAKAITAYREALDIAEETGGAALTPLILFGLSRALLSVGNLEEALHYCDRALARESTHVGYRAALVRALILLNQSDPAAEEAFEEAIRLSSEIVDHSPNIYRAHYMLATALVGKAVLDPQWVEANYRDTLLEPFRRSFGQALQVYDGKGIIFDIRHDLEVIRAAGVEGLEAVFALLDEHL